MQIRAAVTRSKSSAFEFVDMELDALREDEILVEIKAVGLCHTDLVARDQILPIPLPAVFGHEGAGIVVETGPPCARLRQGTGWF